MPNIYDIFETQRKERKREERKRWREEHLFDILNLIVAVLALIVSVFGLFLPKSDNVTDIDSHPQETNTYCGQLYDVNVDSQISNPPLVEP